MADDRPIPHKSGTPAIPEAGPDAPPVFDEPARNPPPVVDAPERNTEF